jgi:protein-tyrosine phosphatase
MDIRIDSAGTGGWHIGEAPCPNSVKVAKMNGIDISGLKGRQVCSEDFEIFDHIIALDEKNRSDLQALGCKNVRKLGEFGFDGMDVPDPYFFDGFEGFEKVYEMIATGVANILDKIRRGKL